MQNEWPEFHNHILQLEQEGIVTRTFRRLDPERQQAILTAILDQAAKKGPTALNIKQVADQAGVSVGSLYTYFNNREGLLDFAIELSTRYTVGAFDYYRPYLSSLPLREGLAAYLTGGVEWSTEQASMLRLFARAAYQGDPDLLDRVVEPIAASLLEIVRDMVNNAAERGEIRPDVDLNVVARLIHALMIVVGDSQLLPYLNTYFKVNDETMPQERILSTLLDLVLNGIGANHESTGYSEKDAS
ncbi:MAG: TetR/AcrR family transcriptional regulator [Anaerolineales bacterium]|nr:TetR/AcrR family transcriptional regulator [Anaerolineales bacterium]